MKFLHEISRPELVQAYLSEINDLISQDWTLMEFCGGQTHSLVKNGLLDISRIKIHMVHGPGCPVCVTPLGMIDQAIELAMAKDVILCSFGDMLRVPGSEKSLLEARGAGGDVRFLYSPMEAVKIAQQNPDKEVIFFAVGFEPQLRPTHFPYFTPNSTVYAITPFYHPHLGSPSYGGRAR